VAIAVLASPRLSSLRLCARRAGVFVVAERARG
jgi:hypothetical protein